MLLQLCVFEHSHVHGLVVEDSVIVELDIRDVLFIEYKTVDAASVMIVDSIPGEGELTIESTIVVSLIVDTVPVEEVTVESVTIEEVIVDAVPSEEVTVEYVDSDTVE